MAAYESSLNKSSGDLRHSNKASKSSEDGARPGGRWLPADEDDDGGVARSSPRAGVSRYDSNSIGSTLVSGNNWR